MLFSAVGTVDKIALLLLVLNIFNIEISVGSAVIVATPIVVKKIVQTNRHEEHRNEFDGSYEMDLSQPGGRGKKRK